MSQRTSSPPSVAFFLRLLTYQPNIAHVLPCAACSLHAQQQCTENLTWY